MVCVLGPCLGAVPAVAQTPPAPLACPAAPADYTGADELLDELRDQRIDAAAACAVLVDKLDGLERVEVEPADAVVFATRVTNTAEDRVQVAGDPDGDAAPVVESVDELRGWLHADLWWMGGLVASMGFGYALYRLVMPRA